MLLLLFTRGAWLRAEVSGRGADCFGIEACGRELFSVRGALYERVASGREVELGRGTFEYEVAFEFSLADVSGFTLVGRGAAVGRATFAERFEFSIADPLGRGTLLFRIDVLLRDSVSGRATLLPGRGMLFARSGPWFETTPVGRDGSTRAGEGFAVASGSRAATTPRPLKSPAFGVAAISGRPWFTVASRLRLLRATCSWRVCSEVGATCLMRATCCSATVGRAVSPPLPPL